MAPDLTQPSVFDDLDACVDLAIERVGKELILGAPLGLGKPVQLINRFYERARQDSSIRLHVYTALSLEVPVPAAGVESSLAGPIVERLFGDYEGLSYLPDLRAGSLPDNISVSELYVKAGSMKGVAAAQQAYISSNYTHIARDMVAAGVNVLCQLVAFRENDGKLELSLSSNPDTSLDMLTELKSRGNAYVALGQLHPDLPFMEHDAVVPAESFTALARNPAWDRRLFAVPNAAVPASDYATAMHASALVVDGGTLQIGIGSLGDAVAQSLILRHNDNPAYRELMQKAAPAPQGLAHLDRFDEGLYVSTEMFVNGMMHLIEHDIVKRRVYDSLEVQRGLNSGAISEEIDDRLYDYACEHGVVPRTLNQDSLRELKHLGIVGDDVALDDSGEQLLAGEERWANDTRDPATRAALLGLVEGRQLRNGRFLHGGFFLGPADFYAKLRDGNAELHEGICMTSVLRTNQLLRDPELYCAQRKDARFINTGMMVALSGAVTSDALEDGTIVSGVGGQYNFVAMAHDLPGARSVLCVRATRHTGTELVSNIVPHYGHVTIPRHLRDIVVTEYGIADLRGQCDAEVIKRLLAIADSRFQNELMEFAKNAGKLEADYEIPVSARSNTPALIREWLGDACDAGRLPDYPFGTDLTEEEITLAASLRRIKALSAEPRHFLARAFRALLHHADSATAQPYLERIQLEHPHTSREFLIQQLLLLDLEERGLLKVS